MASPDAAAALLILNAGSSSLKFAVHECPTGDEPATRMIWRGQFARLDTAQPQLSLSDRQGRKILQQELEPRPRGEEATELFENQMNLQPHGEHPHGLPEIRDWKWSRNP